MKSKDFEARIKAGPDDGLPEGSFTAYASVFDNVDSYGDVVKQGAFAKSLTQWAEKGDSIPVLFGHNMSDPDYNIGHVVEAEEDDHGLKVNAQLDLANPKAQQVYRLLKGRRLSQLSFAYDVQDAAPSKANPGATDLNQLKLYEVSLVPIGANQETEILSVKSAEQELLQSDAELPVQEKAGRVLAAKHLDALKAAHAALGDVIAAADSAASDEEGKASEAPAVNDEEPEAAKSDEQPAVSSVESLSLIIETLSKGA